MLFSMLAFVLLQLQSSWANFNAGVPLHGFIDAAIGHGSKNQIPREKIRGFQMGTFDLYLTPQFSDRVVGLIETAVEPDIVTGEAGIDLERIQVGYILNDQLTLWMGRFHTPFGYWNNAFHHGAQIQTSIAKPRFIDWEDHTGIMSNHSVGFWARGATRMESGSKILYDFFLANGSKITDSSLDMDTVRDTDGKMSVGANFGYAFSGALRGLILAVHWMNQQIQNVDSITVDNPTPVTSKMNFYGAYLVYEENNFEISSEYYKFNNKNISDANPTKHNSTAWFAQVGYYVLDKLIPYYRYEKTNLDNDDYYFNQQRNGISYTKNVVGMRYNLNPRAALKLEGTKTNINKNTDFGIKISEFKDIRMQYAISF